MPSSERHTPKYILAGFNKTGTKSVGDAFEQLGYKVFDAKETYSVMLHHWADVFEGKITIEDIARIYEEKGADVLIDIPCSTFWRQFKEIWPDVKIILTVRENNEVWYKSVHTFFEELHRWPLQRLYPIMYLTPTGYRSMKHLCFPALYFQFGTVKTHSAYYDMDNPSVKHMLTTRYEAHNAHVMLHCPPNDLLIMNVKEGWRPLCNFIGISERDEPLPHLNQSGVQNEVQQYISEMMADYTWRCKKEIFCSLFLILVIIPTLISTLVVVYKK